MTKKKHHDETPAPYEAGDKQPEKYDVDQGIEAHDPNEKKEAPPVAPKPPRKAHRPLPKRK